MIDIAPTIEPRDLLGPITQMFAASADKIRRLHERWKPSDGAPVFTRNGQYTSRGWTEWTQGFIFGSALLQFEADRNREFLELGRGQTVAHMAPHLTHRGVHDHGFNNVSTYGNLLRLMAEGLIAHDPWERRFYELALKVSGAVQAGRWTALSPSEGYVYSFNGPHSLFADTMRSLRALAISHLLGHRLMEENDRPVNLLERVIQHALATARYNVYRGDGRDAYDAPGRVAHESIFNVTDGQYRCPCTQQGYSPFSTWTRGLAWILCGFAEQLEFLLTLSDDSFPPAFTKEGVLATFEKTARLVAEFFIANTPTDGVPYWDTGAPGLTRMGDYLSRPAEPRNDFEPVDSSAAAIAAQGYIRLGRFLGQRGMASDGQRYARCGLSIARTLLAEPYLSLGSRHEGLLLHSVYHRPNGWDYIPAGQRVPCGESSAWGDYHLRELAVLILREASGRPQSRFCDVIAKRD